MWDKRTTFNILKQVEKDLSYEEFKKLTSDSDFVDFKMFKSACDTLRTQSEKTKNEMFFKKMIKRKANVEGDVKYPEYPKPDDENNDNEYPYPRRKPKYPKVLEGTISLQEFLDYLENFARFKNMPFIRSRIEKVLKSPAWRALVNGDRLNHLILCRVSELLHS